MLGGYSAFGVGARVSRVFQIPAHRRLRLKARVLGLDTWDDEEMHGCLGIDVADDDATIVLMLDLRGDLPVDDFLDEAGDEETREILQEAASDRSTTGKPDASTDVPLAIREVPAAARRSGRETALWLFAIAFLIMTLLGQVGYFKRDDLARRYTSLRPYIEKFCQYAGCRLGTTGDIATIHILDRQVRSHPQQKGALQVTATIASSSQLTQPFPDVMLAMSDRQGTGLAGRIDTIR